LACADARNCVGDDGQGAGAEPPVELLISELEKKCKGCGCDVQELLAEHLSTVQRLLVANSQHMSSLIAKRMEHTQELEVEVTDLRAENEKLRAKVLSHGLLPSGCVETGGTGELSCLSVGPRKGWMPQSTGFSQDLRASPARAPCPVAELCAPAPAEASPSIALPGLVQESLAHGKAESSRAAQRPGAATASAVAKELTAVVPLGPTAEELQPDARGQKDAESRQRGITSRISAAGAAVEAAADAAVDVVFGHPKPVFADAAAMKEKLKEAIGKREYNVADFYHETGIWQRIATSTLFEHMTLVVIGLNALWIAHDTDSNKAAVLVDAPVYIRIVEHLFCTYFVVEWTVRFMAFKYKRDCRRDAWFMFDSVLVLMMAAETWMLSLIWTISGGAQEGGMSNVSMLRVFRLFRLTRMARMVRLLRAMPELMVMVKAMTVALRSVFFALCLLVALIYIFAIGFTQMLEGTDVGEESFKTVPMSMNTLLLEGTLPDQAGIVNAVGDQHLVFRLAMLLYILLASLTVMNMLVGILCEVVSVVSAVEKEELLINFVKGALSDMLQKNGIDADNDHHISKAEFLVLLQNSDALKALQEVGVDAVGLVDFTDFIFATDEAISFATFMDTVLQLRGSNTATVKDIVDLRKVLMVEIQRIEERCVHLATGVERTCPKLS